MSTRPSRNAPSGYGGYTAMTLTQPPQQTTSQRDRIPSPEGRASLGGYGNADASTTGYTSDSTSGGFDGALDATGLSTSAVQVGILRGKLKAQEGEIGRMKKELREASERAASLAAKLNDVKLQNNGTTHKYSTAVAKLSAAEANEKQLEDALMAEQRAHNQTKEQLERARQQQRGKEEGATSQIRQLEERLARMAELQQNAEANAVKSFSDQQRTQFMEAQEKLLRENHTLLEMYREGIERLCDARDEDEAQLFVARSAAVSTATELDARLSAAQAHLEALTIAFRGFIEECDQDTNQLIGSLMSENKDLWSRFSKLQFEQDQLSGQLAVERRRARELDGPAKEQMEYLQQQLATAEEKLLKCRDTIDSQTQRERALEEQMQGLMDDNRAMQLRLEQATQEKTSYQRAEAEASARAKELTTQLQSAQLDSEEAQRQVSRLVTECERLDIELQTTRESAFHEARSSLAKLRTECDDAKAAYERTRSELTDCQSRLLDAERQLEIKQEQYNTFNIKLEETHAAYERTLQEELKNHKRLYEERLEHLQREAQDSTAEAAASSREVDRLRAEVSTLKAQLQRAEEAAAESHMAEEDARDAVRRLDDRLRAITLDRDAARNAALGDANRCNELEVTITQLRQAAESESSGHLLEQQRLQQQLRHLESLKMESEQQRILLVEEVRKMRLRGADDQALAQLREKAERDRQLLQAENERLQSQHSEAQHKCSSQQATIAQLKQRLTSTIQLQAQVDELQRLVQELPGLREALEECQREVRRTQDEARELQRERDEMASKVEFFLEESRNAARKDMDLDRVFREATLQVRRLDRQIDEVAHSVTRRREGSLSPAASYAREDERRTASRGGY